MAKRKNTRLQERHKRHRRERLKDYAVGLLLLAVMLLFEYILIMRASDLAIARFGG